MAGTFTIGQTKQIPGVYHRRENAGGVSLAGAINGIGAGIIRANWGPLNTPVDFEPSTDVKRIFGSGHTEDLITEMFNGGISSGKFVRIGAGGTAPKIELKGIDGDEVSVIITGAYVGNRAFTLTLRDNLAGDKRECIIYEGLTEFVKADYNPEENEAEALKAALEAATSDFVVTIPRGSDGTILEELTQQPFTAGANPTTTTEAYSAGLSALEAATFNVLCVDTEDAAVHALVNAFLNRIYEAGSFPMACVAETANVSLEERMKHAAAFNNEKMHYCLNPAYDASGNLYDGYRLAARIGGIIASTPANQSVTHTVISGFSSVAEALTNTQTETALGRGCIVLAPNSSDQVWIVKGINTLITPDGDMDEGWKKIRRVKTRFELMQRVGATIDTLVGRVNNDTDGRATIIAAGQGVINAMVGEKKLGSTTKMAEDSNNPPQGDSAWFIIAVDDIDSVEVVYLVYRFQFASAA